MFNLDVSLSHLQTTSNFLRSKHGQQVLQAMQVEFIKESTPTNNLKNRIVELKLENEKIGLDLEDLFQELSSKSIEAFLNDSIFTDVFYKKSIEHGIPRELVLPLFKGICDILLDSGSKLLDPMLQHLSEELLSFGIKTELVNLFIQDLKAFLLEDSPKELPKIVDGKKKSLKKGNELGQDEKLKTLLKVFFDQYPSNKYEAPVVKTLQEFWRI